MFENSFRKGITNAIEQAHLCNQYIAGRPIKTTCVPPVILGLYPKMEYPPAMRVDIPFKLDRFNTG